MRLQEFKLSKLKIFKKANVTVILFFIIIVLIFLQFLIVSPNEVNLTASPSSNVQKLKMMAEAQKEKKSVEQKMMGVHLVENSKDQKGWELFAEEAAGSEDANWVLKKVKITFFAEDNSAYTVTGDIGEIEGASKNIVIRGQVLTKSTNGYEFKTNDLSFDSKLKQLYSVNSVQMTGPDDQTGAGFIISGVGFRVDLTKNKMSILAGVEASKIINGNLFEIRSKQAMFSNRSQEAIFDGAVQMNYQKATMTAPIAFFKYSSEKKMLKTVLVQKGVSIKELDRSSAAQELEISLLEDKMTLRGSPKVQMGQDEITGGEIVFSDGGKKVKINKVEATGNLDERKKQ